MLPEKLEPVAVDLYGRPGVRIDESGEVTLQLLDGELVGNAAIVPSQPTNRPGIHVDRFVGVALELQGPLVAKVKGVESLLLA
jgi:hypothetical protein